MKNKYKEKLYSGILGKIIGVYFGRPVEGWSYDRIRETFGIVDHYVNKELDMPLHVPDDDLSGTFAFLRTLDDAKDIHNIDAKDFGETWLDYIIEERSTFWWGGVGRSTEHTAYSRLRTGYKSPQSGSIELNGKGIAEQIGAQIFMDGFAMLCPDDPQKARELVKQAASVSHDGIAVESACFLATMEALAFSIDNLEKLIQLSLTSAPWSKNLTNIINNVISICKKNNNWRDVRNFLDENYGYHLYPGNCHVIPNLTLLLSSLILGGDSFKKALEIAVSSGWDTDCNAANICCINGIRLGLDAINKEFDYRSPIADRFYCITSYGSQCVTDAVIQTRRLLKLHNLLYNKKKNKKIPRFSFELPGSVQGFTNCPLLAKLKPPVINGNMIGMESGLVIDTTEGTDAISTLTFWDCNDRYGSYSLLGSPTLYYGQTIRAEIKKIEGNPIVQLYVIYYDKNDILKVLFGPSEHVDDKKNIEWTIDDLDGMPVFRVGLQIVNKDSNSKILLKSMDWCGSPILFSLKGGFYQNKNNLQPIMALQAFTSSAKHFSFDKRYTFTISHPEENGIVDIGTEQWDNYSVSATIIPCMASRFGLTFRTKGHRHFYAAVIDKNQILSLIIMSGEKEHIVKSISCYYELDNPLALEISGIGSNITISLNNKNILKANCEDYYTGGAGFLVSQGTIMADNFMIKKLD
ncbi:ADP-ribosylglycohydrolase family protein [Treponema parvum]|uniref:ADP-ribosylglycohydrolase family protein n=1 Tax=Treponema parvum TaxID=138851 RepID=A0A975IF80_9SPIR|nr:ADP-ribosylglycohydrolase family protein [Treponema parvum]QTQ14592.1 ADP-ribosylglycohydrolase family protein [Treponema parvum]